MSEQVMVKYQGQEQSVSIDDIAGNLQMENIESNYGFESCPEGTYVLNCVRNDIGTQEYTPKKGPRAGQTVTDAVVDFEFEIVDVLTMKDSTKNPVDWVGAEHRERFFIQDLAKDLGRVQALMSDSGKPAVGPLRDSMNAFIGHKFVAVIKNRKNPDDPDIVYANINLRQVRPLQPGEGGASAPPPAATGANVAAPAPDASMTQPTPGMAAPAQPAQSAAGGALSGLGGGQPAGVAPALGNLTGTAA